MKIKAKDMVKSFDRLESKLTSKLIEADQPSFIYLCKFVVDMIVKRTKLGFGVKDSGEKREKLKQLKGRPSPYESTIYTRERLKKKGELSSDTTPTKSNLTMTGQMLNAISYKAKKLGGIIFIKGSQRSNGKNSNLEVAKYVSEARPFFHLSDSEIRQLRKEAVKLVRSKLKNRALTKILK